MNFDDGKDIDPGPPPPEPEDEGESLQEDGEAVEVKGKAPVSGWMAILGTVVGAAIVAVAVAVSSPVLAAVGVAVALVSVTLWLVAKLADYAVTRPFRRAGNALSGIYNGAAKAARGDWQGARKALADVEALDWLSLLLLLLALVFLARLATGKLKKRNKGKRR